MATRGKGLDTCLFDPIAMKTKHGSYWNSIKERVKNDDETNGRPARQQQYPGSTNAMRRADEERSFVRLEARSAAPRAKNIA